MTRPSEKDIERFQAQLALALIKRQLHEGGHLSAEQLAQLLTHTAAPDEALQWKQHLNDCQDCYAVFLDVAQTQLEQQVAIAPAKSWRTQWRYALVAMLPMILVATLYYGLPQQPAELQREVLTSESAVQFEYKKNEEADEVVTAPSASAQPKAKMVLPENVPVTAMPAEDVQPMEEPLSASAPAASLERPADTAAYQDSSQAPKTINSPMISVQANERARAVEADTLARRESAAPAPTPAAGASSELAAVTASLAKTESTDAVETADAETIEVTGARPSAIDLVCDESCTPDDRFDEDLDKWLTEMEAKCKEHKLNLLQVRTKWRALLERHQTAKRNELAKAKEPNTVEGWCELSRQLAE